MQLSKYFTVSAIACGALLVMGVLVPTAMANPVLPGYTTGGGCTAGPDFVAPAPFCSQSLPGGADSLFYSLTPVPSLVANASAIDDHVDDLAYSAILNLTYSFEVVGGTAGDTVPLLISTNLVTSIIGLANAYATIFVTTSLDSKEQQSCSLGDSGSNPCTATSFSGFVSIGATSGTVDQISLQVEVGAALGNNGVTVFPSSASASADPVISIDPSFAGASNYQIELSQGIGNTGSSAPEPGTFLLVGAFWPMAVLVRRLRAKSV